MTSTVTMNDDLLDNYNPLYDVHLRQYFAMPHMQRHLRNIGLLDDVGHGENVDDRESNKQHHTMIDKMLRNREAELQKYADLQRKLHAAEKIEICRRIRSGAASPSDCHRAKPSRSLSRGRYIKKSRRRRSSASTDDKDLVQRIEAENEEPMYENPSLVYNRLSTNILKYRYLHKLDDETLALYMEQLRRQLSRLERFRQVSFGPFSVARHQNDPQVSWFFRRRSLPSLTDTTPTTTITTTTTTTITSSTTQSNLYEQPTLRSIQSLNQHRSRSSKPQSQRNGVSDNSHNRHSQSKRQRSTENNARLPAVSRNVKSGPTAINNTNVTKTPRIRKSTPIESKKVTQKTTAIPTGRKPLGVAQKIKPKTDSELTDVQATVSAARKLIAKSKMESVERRSEESPLNFDDEREVYSGVTSPESIDLIPGKETVSEKSASPLEHLTMPADDEKRSQSNVSEQMIEEPKIEQLKVGDEQNSNLPFDLSPEISEKTELETVNMRGISEAPPVSKWAASEAVENPMSHEASTDSFPNETDSHGMISPKEIEEDQRLAGNVIETENKSERLFTGENLIAEKGIVQIDNQQDQNQSEEMFEESPNEALKLVEDKMTIGEFEKPGEIIPPPIEMLTSEAEEPIFPEDKLPEMNGVEIPVKEPEIMPADNNTFSYTEIEMANQKVPSNETGWDVNEFTVTNGETLEISPDGKLKGHDPVVLPEIYLTDSKEEILATEKNLAEAMDDPISSDEGLVSFAIFPEKVNSVEKLESNVSYTEIEFSDGEQEVLKTESAADQSEEEHAIERSSKSPEAILVPDSETSVTNDESLKLPKSEISFEQLKDSFENEQEMSNAGDLNERMEIVNGITERDELESAKDVFQMEKLPACLVSEQLKYQEKIGTENKVIDGVLKAKIQQPVADVDDLESDSKSQTQTEENPESIVSVFDVSMNDAPLIENSHSKVNEEIIGSMELQQEKKEVPEATLEVEVLEAEARAGMEITNNGFQKVNDVLQAESETPESETESVGRDSVIQQFSQCMKSSVHDYAPVEENKTVVQETTPETGEMIAAEKKELPEVILLNPENLIIEGLTNNSEPVITGMFILTPSERMKQELDGQINALISSTLDTMMADANHLLEKECDTEEMENLVRDKSTDELNSMKVDFESSEGTGFSFVSNIPRSDITSIESNSELTSEEKSGNSVADIPERNTEEMERRIEAVEEMERRIEVDEENEILPEAHYASREQLPSETCTHEYLEQITVAGKSKYSEEIPKIVVCSDETTVSDEENVEKLTIQSDAETVELQEQFQTEANAETLDQQKLLLERTKDLEQTEISKSEEVITSVGNGVPKEIDDGKQLMRGQLNEFLQQYMHDMVQNVAQSAENRSKTSEASEEEEEKDEIQKIDNSVVSVPECILEFPDQISEISSPISESDEALQRRVENLNSHSNIFSSMLTVKANDSDESSKVSELCDTTGELNIVSHPYHTDITRELQGGRDHFMLSGHESNIGHDILLQQRGSYTIEDFPKDTELIRPVVECAQELELENEKLMSEIPQINNSRSSTNNMLPNYRWVINGVTADGQLILGSVNDSLLLSEDKFINYYAPNDDVSEIVNEKIPLVSDTNGNPEWKVYDMQYIPSDVLNESNICAADVNANISAMQETVHMKSIKREQEMGQHSTLTDEHLSLESNNGGTEEREAINVNREHSVS